MELQIQNNKTVQAISSVEVAQMVEKDHSKLLRDIRQYSEYLGEAKIGQSEFFVESTYMNSQNKEQPCYLITKKGCDLVGNKITGKKGTIFTAKYVSRFEELEKASIALPNDPMETLRLMFQATDNVTKEVKDVRERVSNIEENARLDPGQYDHIVRLVSKRIATIKDVHKLKLNKKQNGELFHGLNKEIKEITGVRTRSVLRQKDFDRVCEFVSAWEPSSATMQRIKDLSDCSAQ